MNILEKIKVIHQKRQAASQAKIRSQFLPEALEIVENPVSPTGHWLIITIVMIVLFFAGWSLIGKMDEVVTARGMIITVSGVQEVQAVSGGIVEEICVKEGETVKAGQPIVKIDSSINTISLENTTETLELLEYENELLRKLVEGEEISIDESESAGRETIYNYVLAMKTEYESQKSEIESNVQQALSQIEIEKEALSKLEENRKYLTAQKDRLTEVLQYANTEQYESDKLALEIQYQEGILEDYKKLFEAGAIPKSDVDAIEKDLEQLKKDLEIQKANVVSEDYNNGVQQYELENQLIIAQKDCNSQEGAVKLAEEKYKQTLESLETLEANFKTNLTNLIVQNQNTINAQEVNQEIQRITVAEQTLVSPVDGIVKTLEINTVGGVVSTSQIVSTVVPKDSQMIVEIDVQNRDIGYIETGQEVVIKLDTFDFQEYGKLEGTVVFISPDAVWTEGYGWIYKAKIAIDGEKFKQQNPSVEIGVGMECTAEIKVGERRIIDFFLEPIVEHFDGSLKIR